METDKEVLNIEPWFAAQNAVGNYVVQIFSVNFLSVDNVLIFLIPTGLSTLDPFPYIAKFQFLLQSVGKNYLTTIWWSKCDSRNVLL